MRKNAAACRICFLTGALCVCTFPKEMKMLVKERSSGMYHLAAFFIARTVSHLPLDLLYPSSFVFIVYFMGGLRLTVCPPLCTICCSGKQQQKPCCCCEGQHLMSSCRSCCNKGVISS
jgi:hypothetical protein